jgi:hypothetical protein
MSALWIPKNESPSTGEPMDITAEQRILLESSLTFLETGIGQMNVAIEQFDQQRAVWIAQRDAALKQLADARVKLGIVTTVQ